MCDDCGIRERASLTPMGVRKSHKKRGWSVKVVDGKTKDFCPNCTPDQHQENDNA